jgi:hypothetical protein
MSFVQEVLDMQRRIDAAECKWRAAEKRAAEAEKKYAELSDVWAKTIEPYLPGFPQGALLPEVYVDLAPLPFPGQSAPLCPAIQVAMPEWRVSEHAFWPWREPVPRSVIQSLARRIAERAVVPLAQRLEEVIMRASPVRARGTP